MCLRWENSSKTIQDSLWVVSCIAQMMPHSWGQKCRQWIPRLHFALNRTVHNIMLWLCGRILNVHSVLEAAKLFFKVHMGKRWLAYNEKEAFSTFSTRMHYQHTKWKSKSTECQLGHDFIMFVGYQWYILSYVLLYNESLGCIISHWNQVLPIPFGHVNALYNVFWVMDLILHERICSLID